MKCACIKEIFFDRGKYLFCPTRRFLEQWISSKVFSACVGNLHFSIGGLPLFSWFISNQYFFVKFKLCPKIKEEDLLSAFAFFKKIESTKIIPQFRSTILVYKLGEIHWSATVFYLAIKLYIQICSYRVKGKSSVIITISYFNRRMKKGWVKELFQLLIF